MKDTKYALIGLAFGLMGCSAQADFPDVRASAGLPLSPEDYTGAFVMTLDLRAAAEHNSDLGVPVDITLRSSPSGSGPADMNAPEETLQFYHVELFTESGAVTRCTVQEGDSDGAYSNAACRRAGDIVQIVVSGAETARLIFEVAKPQDGGPLTGRGFLQHPVLPVSPSIGAVTLTPAGD